MTLPIERLLSMRAFAPLIELRRYLSQNQGLSPAAAALALRDINETFAASDHEAALTLHGVLTPDLTFLDLDPVVDLRAALAFLVTSMRPQWARRAHLGRTLFLAGLPEDVKHCFRSAILLDDLPDDDVIRWWDKLCNELRSIQNFEMQLQGRDAERRSLEHERARVRALGIDLEPRWQSLDDNTVGFDILSYRLGETEPVNILIEVKSSSRNPPVIIISRNEWNKAAEVGNRYLFHLWDIRAGALFECPASEVAPHIPDDCGIGEWTYVAIPVRALRAFKQPREFVPFGMRPRAVFRPRGARYMPRGLASR